jgi:C1A family cysteine protease
MKESLYMNGPFVGGVYVYECWDKPSVEKTGVIPMPKKNEEMLGGHAICIMGYDNKKRRFKFKNSWSTAWGEKGYGYIPYKYVEKYGADIWSAKDRLNDAEKAKEIVKAIEGRK